jgi:hypothetical protein
VSGDIEIQFLYSSTLSPSNFVVKYIFLMKAPKLNYDFEEITYFSKEIIFADGVLMLSF